MSLTEQIAKNAAWLAVGKILSTATGVFVVALLLRYLSPDDFGRYTTVLAFVLLFGTFVDFGLNLTTTQDISLPNVDVARTLSSIFTLRLLVNMALLALLPAILLLFPYETGVKNAIMVTSALFFTSSLFQVLASYFQKELQAQKVALAELAGRAVLLAATLAAISLGFSFFEIMYTVVISSLVQFWVLLRFTSRAIKLTLCVDTAIWKRIMKKAWPIALSVVFTTIYFKGDSIILSLTRPYQDVGIYGAAYKILEVLIALPILFMGLVLPHLSNSFAAGDKERFGRLIQKSWDALVLVTMPMVAGTLALARPIIRLIAGPGYEPSATVLQILIIAAGIIFLGSLFAHAVVAVNKQRSMIACYAIAAGLAVVLYILFIPTYSYYAAALVTVLAELIIACTAFVVVRRAAHITLSISVLVKAGVASGIMALVLVLISGFMIFITIPAGVAVYLLGLLALRVPIRPYLRARATI